MISFPRGQQRNPAAAKNEIAVHDGREKISIIVEQSRTSFQARDADNTLLGIFESKRAAVAAIWAARESGPGAQ